jgi:hypothetical protein
MGCRTLPKFRTRLENGSGGLEAPQQGQTNRLTRMPNSAAAADGDRLLTEDRARVFRVGRLIEELAPITKAPDCGRQDGRDV